MKNKLGITKGVWRFDARQIKSAGRGGQWTQTMSVFTEDSEVCNFIDFSRDQKEIEANAQPIAEAGTVSNETGKTPRQLADENKELLETLEDIVRNSSPINKGFHACPNSVINHASLAIKKATGN